MDQGQQKAHTHPYGSTVIGGAPLQGPLGQRFVASMQPEQLQADGRIPQHAGSVSVTVGGDVTPPTSADKLATMIGGFLDQLIEHVADRVHEKVVAGAQDAFKHFEQLEQQHKEEDEALSFSPKIMVNTEALTVENNALVLLSDFLDERGIDNLSAVDEHLLTKMLIVEGTPGKRRTFITFVAEPAPGMFETAFDQEPPVRLDLLATLELLTERTKADNSKRIDKIEADYKAYVEGDSSQR